MCCRHSTDMNTNTWPPASYTYSPSTSCYTLMALCTCCSYCVLLLAKELFYFGSLLPSVSKNGSQDWLRNLFILSSQSFRHGRPKRWTFHAGRLLEKAGTGGRNVLCKYLKGEAWEVPYVSEAEVDMTGRYMGGNLRDGQIKANVKNDVK